MAVDAPPVRPATLAVVVSAGVSTYLPRTLAAVAAQTHAPDVVVVVDVGAPGRDLGTGVPVHEAVADAGLERVSRVRVVRAPAATTFGEAVRQGLVAYGELVERAARRARKRGWDGHLSHLGTAFRGGGWAGVTGELNPVTTGEIRAVGAHGAEPETQAQPDWLWLLHDDSAPDRHALDRLLRAAESGRSVAVVGAKQRDWDQPDRLLEVGIRATRTGRRVADIEPGEIDQGQHDHREDVLAVGLAGALVRADVWTELDGPDPALGPFGDGLDLCRRARLAGHRVVVVPTAVVHHARAGYLGLRGTGGLPAAPDRPDARRSFAARRRAQLHNALVAAPAWAVPVLVLGLVVAAPLRALARVAGKELGLAGAEVAAALAVLASPGALWRARRRAAATRRLPPRALAPLQATGRDIRRAKRDARRQAAAARRAAQAPSEPGLAERAALARRRRATLAVLGAALLAVGLVVFLPVALRGALTGGALLPADAGLGGLWAAARSGWVATGDGAAGPADPLLTVLAVGMLPLAPFGASTSVLLAALVVLAVPLAGLGAWFAAGAATRAVTVRAWAAALWALAPTLLVAAGQGRVGAVLAHLALPWVALGIARAVGVERRDVIASGLVGARRVRRPGSPAGAGAGPAEDGPTTGTGTTATGRTGATVVPAAAAGGRTGATAGAAAAAAGRTGATAAPESDRTGTTTAAGRTGGTVAQGPPELPAGQAAEAAPAPGPAVPDPRPARTGSIAAGAGAALALAVAAAGAPALLPAAVVAVVLLAPVLPRHRLAVLAVPLPAVALLGPLLHAATADLPGGSWRLLLADPGPALATAAPEACVSALGWPVPPPAPDGWPAAVAPYLALAGGAALVLAAAAALLRGGGRARAVRAGWLLAVLGLVLMLGSARVDVALGTDLAGAPAVARGWPGAGLSLAVLGLLLAAVAGADGVRGALAARSFGVAQVGVAVLALAAVLGPALTTAGWLRAVPDEPALLALTGRTRVPVPAVAAEMQGSPARARVLALTPQDGTVRAELWRGPGRQLTETAAAAAARPLTGAPTASVVPADDADADLAGLVARLAVGAAEDAGPELGAHAIGVVLVPPVGDVAPADDAETDGGGADAETDGGGADGGAAVDEAAADDAARTDLIARLDATAGLERVTENATGVVWRVATAAGAEGAAPSVARARVLADGETVQDVDAEVVGIDTKLPNGPEGRTLVLAERADPGWRAWYDGRPLRAVPQGWQQAFELPAHTGTLTLTYAAPWSTLWSWVQGVVLGLAVLLAVPVRRRRSEED